MTHCTCHRVALLGCAVWSGRALALLCLALFALTSQAQDTADGAFAFLQLPASPHAAALGGDNISIDDDDATLVFHNPALLCNVSARSLALSYMNVMEDVKTATAAYTDTWGNRTAWAVSARLADYGEMHRTDAANTDLGTFSAKDIALAASLAYLLSDHWSGGLTLRYCASHIAEYRARAIAADLGLNYTDAERLFSLSATVRGLGAEVETYDGLREALPTEVTVGLSKQLANAPLRFSATLSDVTRWNRPFFRHLAVGADLFLGSRVYLAAGYNFLGDSDASRFDGDDALDSRRAAGFSCGGGLRLQRLQFHVAWTSPRSSSSSLLLSLAYVL